MCNRDKKHIAYPVCIRVYTLQTNSSLVNEINETLFFQSARFWFLLLDRVDFRVQVGDLREEIRMLQQSLDIGDVTHFKDVKLTATIHKTYLGRVVSLLDVIKAEGGVLFKVK